MGGRRGQGKVRGHGKAGIGHRDPRYRTRLGHRTRSGPVAAPSRSRVSQALSIDVRAAARLLALSLARADIITPGCASLHGTARDGPTPVSRTPLHRRHRDRHIGYHHPARIRTAPNKARTSCVRRLILRPRSRSMTCVASSSSRWRWSWTMLLRTGWRMISVVGWDPSRIAPWLLSHWPWSLIALAATRTPSSCARDSILASDSSSADGPNLIDCAEAAAGLPARPRTPSRSSHSNPQSARRPTRRERHAYEDR